MTFQLTLLFLVALAQSIVVNAACNVANAYPKNGICHAFVQDRSFYLNSNNNNNNNNNNGDDDDTSFTTFNRATSRFSTLIDNEERYLSERWLSAQDRQVVGDQCAAKYEAYLCEQSYPQCKSSSNNNLITYRCQQTCSQLVDDVECRGKLQAISRFNHRITAVLDNLNCVSSNDSIEYRQCLKPVMLAQTEATDMVDVAAAIAAATTTPNWQLAGNVTDDIICPSPLVQDPAWPRYSKVAHCINGCCIPCPMTNAFYPPNRLEIGFRIATLIRGVSGLLMLFLLVSYLILPNKRKYPTSLIFFSIISLMAFCIPSFFVLTDPKKIQCTDEITQSTMSNNIACGIQGAILIFGSFGACLWIAAVILNLHLHTVWNSQWMSKHYKWIVAIGWIYCAAGAAVPLAMNIVQYDYAELCLVSKEKSGIFFWPLGAVVFPAVFLHVWTFIYIIRVRRNARGHTSPGSNPSSHGAVIRAQKMLVMETVRLQWRAMLLSVALTSALIFYWIFYFVEIRRTTQSHSTEALPAWFKCIAAGRGQSECASIMAPELPSYQIMIAAEIAVSIQGVTFFLIFGMQRRLFSEWRMYLGRQSARRSAIKTVSQRHSRFANKSISNGHTTTLMTSNNPWEDKSLESPLPTPTKRRNSTLMSDLMEVPESLPDSMDRLTRATLDSDYYVYDAEEYSRPDVMPLSDMPHLQNNHSTTTTTTTSSYLRSAPSSGSLSTISNNGMEPSPSVVPSSYSTPSNAAGYGTTGVQRNFSPTSTTFHQTYLTPNYQHHDSRTMNMDYSQQHQHQHQQQYTNDHDDMATTTTTTTTNSDNDPSLAPSYRGPRFGGLARAVSQQFGHVEPNGQLPPVPPPRIYQAPR